MNDETWGLVWQIGDSVTAMDGLFNSLLDISRLDAGVVETQVEDFPIEPCWSAFAETISRRPRLRV